MSKSRKKYLGMHIKRKNSGEISKNGFIFFDSGFSFVRVKLEDISYIFFAKEENDIYLVNNNVIKVKNSILEIEEILSKYGFIRISQNCMVAISKIQKIQENIVYLGNASLPISIFYRQDFYQLILG